MVSFPWQACQPVQADVEVSTCSGYNDIDDSVVGAQENSHFGLCSVSGHIGRRAFDSFGSSAVSGRGLCVYADPLYRAPRGTPPQAIEECRVLLSRHNLSPLSICNTQYFVLDHDDCLVLAGRSDLLHSRKCYYYFLLGKDMFWGVEQALGTI